MIKNDEKCGEKASDEGLLDTKEVDGDLPVVHLDPVDVLPIAQRT